MCHIPATDGRAAEWSFHCIAICNAQHPNDHTTGAFFVALHFEFATFERELKANKLPGQIEETMVNAIMCKRETENEIYHGAKI